MNATKTLVKAFISCRLDYCHSLLYGISDGLLQRIQSVQIAAARLVTGARRSDLITCYGSCTGYHFVSESRSRSPGSCINHSLVLLLLILLIDCHLLSDAGRRPLRSHSNDIRRLLVPRTHNKLGDRSFSAAGPRLWNDPPPQSMWQPGLSFDSFR